MKECREAGGVGEKARTRRDRGRGEEKRKEHGSVGSRKEEEQRCFSPTGMPHPQTASTADKKKMWLGPLWWCVH